MRSVKFIMSLLAIFALMASCTGVKQGKKIGYSKRRYLQEHNVVRLPTYDLPIVMNDEVVKWLEYFQGAGRSGFARHLKRSGRYEKMMRTILKQNGLPQDLVYVALIESGFLPHAYSRARAVGTWQFMRATGKDNGLRVDGIIDERRDPELATQAAAKFLRDLYSSFGDWYLALAAYNAGPGKVGKAVSRSGSRDFWEIASYKNLLRDETCNYVPKFIAAALIAKQPEKFGFVGLDYDEPFSYDVVEVDGQIDLTVAASLINSSFDELVELNPALLRGVTPPQRYKIRVPNGRGEEFKVAYANLPEEKRVLYAYHRVRKGQTLVKIARIYGISVEDMEKLNGIPRCKHLKVGSSVKVYRGATRKALYAGDEDGAAGKNYYTMKKGETLGRVAGKFKVKVADLMRWNNISNPKLARAGKKLVVYHRGQGRVVSTKKQFYYSLKSGDTLDAIAKNNGVTVDDLLAWNKIKDPKRVGVGRKLLIKKEEKGQANVIEQTPATKTSPSASLFQYRVQKGDTLWTIAKKNAVTIEELKEWNHIADPNSVRPGSKLIIVKK